MIRLAALLIIVAVASSFSTSRVHAETSTEQTVTATVTGQSVSMTVSPTSIDYGTVPFEMSRTSLAAPGGAVTFVATNTGNVDEDFLVRGSDATGSGFSWSLVAGAVSCGPGSNNNKFRHSVTPSGGPSQFLATSDDTLATAKAPSDTQSFTSEIYMPCFGSDGAGLQATTSIVVTAVAP
jgi:hypothetical protein